MPTLTNARAVLAAAAMACVAAGVAATPRPAAADTLRVWFGSVAPRVPFDTWETAAHEPQLAVDAAQPGDVVLVRGDTTRAYTATFYRCITDCDADTKIFVRGVLFPRSGVRICGEADRPRPILSGGDSVRSVAWVDRARDAMLERIHVRHGGILFHGTFDSTAVVRDCVIEDCHEMEGAGMRIQGHAEPIIERNLFVENVTDTTGHHQNGGAIGMMGSVRPTRATIRWNVFRRNRAGRGGGAIRVKMASPAIENNLFEGNTSRHDGGAIVIQGGKPRIWNNLFRENASDRHGGAIAIAENFGFKGVKLFNNRFERNIALSGGALCVSHGTRATGEMEIANNTFVDCAASAKGASLYVDGPGIEAAKLYVNRNLFAITRGAARAHIESAATGVGFAIDSLACNLFWSPGGDSARAVRSEPGSIGPMERNIYADPMFAPGDTAWSVRPDSPCNGANSPCGEPIGAPAD